MKRDFYNNEGWERSEKMKTETTSSSTLRAGENATEAKLNKGSLIKLIKVISSLLPSNVFHFFNPRHSP